MTFILILTRFRIRHQRNGLKLCDGLVALAWIFFLSQSCMDTILDEKGWFEDKIDPEASRFGPEHGLATLSDTVVALKLIYVETSLYYVTTVYMVKLAMLLTYYEIIP